jgi:hypothetical protein
VVSIFVNNQSIDLLENVSIPITYSIADIRNPEQRQGTFTKTISIPGTKTNNKLFSHIFKISKLSISTDFNPALKADCLILEDSIEILRGSLRLLDISYQENGEIIYNCVVFGETSDLFFSINNDKLTDLDLSAYNHLWTKDSVENSWSATRGIGYIYPMIDYGTNDNLTLSRWAIKDFFPAIYVKQYLDSIFAKAGFTYSSAFFNSAFFKTLIVPFNKQNLKLSAADILNRSASVKMLGATTLDSTTLQFASNVRQGISQQTYNNWGWTEEVNDPNNNFISTGFTAPVNGWYNLDIFFNANSWDVLTYPTGTSATNDRYYNMAIDVVNINTGLKLVQNFTVREQRISDSLNVINPCQNKIYVAAGHVIKVNLIITQTFTYTTNITASSPGACRLIVDSASYFRVTAQEQLAENSPIPIKSVIPENVLCKDFISGLIKMFNLYIEPDKANAKNLIIKTRDTFYSDETNILDWTDKVNYNVPWKITPLGELDFKRLIFRYKDDQDKYNKRYRNSYLEPYGTKNVVVGNDFLTNDKIIEPLFSATPSYRPDLKSISKRIYPIIVSDTEQTTGSNIRILQYPGPKFTDLWTLTSDSGSTYIFNNYPYVGMVNDADNPTYDIAFDVPKEIYWSMNANNYTNNNLYNAYYSKMISEIVDQDSKLIEVEVLLTAQDLFNINFAKKIFINNNYYILNKIIDADRTQTNLTRVELLKLKAGVSFTASTGVTNNFNNVASTTPRVDGGLNIVGSSLNGSPAIIEGGLNEVRSISATSEILIVNGGN